MSDTTKVNFISILKSCSFSDISNYITCTLECAHYFPENIIALFQKICLKNLKNKKIPVLSVVIFSI